MTIAIKQIEIKESLEKFVIKIEEDDIPEPDDSSAFMPQKLQEALDHYIVATAISETLEKPLKPYLEVANRLFPHSSLDAPRG